MSRVKWKGPYIKNKLLDNIKNSILIYKNDIKTTSKNSVILPKFVGLTIQVYNGKTFIAIKIVDEMVGYRLGEFILTRKQFSYKKNKEKPVEDPNKSEAMGWLMEQMLESATGSDPDTPDGKAPDAVNRDSEMPGVKPQKDSNPANNDRPKLQKAKPPTEIKTPPARKNPAMNPTSFTKKPMGAMANIPKPNIPKFKF